MTYEEALDYIHSRGKFTFPAGLERITALMQALGNPQTKVKVVHIAGTNGKGSTATFCASVFRAAGYKTGLFISPFVLDFCERIQVNGAFIPRDELAKYTEQVQKCGIAVNEFELITAVGFLYFAANKCDVVVLETGLGGRLDATNIASCVPVSVITKIGLDHTAVLGETVEQITAEKCGIIKNDVTVTVPHQDETALPLIRRAAERLIVPDLAQLSVESCDLFGNSFLYKGVPYRTRLGGAYQIDNALTAIETVRACGLPVSQEALQNGLQAATFPARLEVLSSDPLVVLDGAHNPDGATVLADALRPFSGKVTAVIGMMRDKNVREFLQITLPLCERVICVTACGMPRALPADELRTIALQYAENVQTADGIEQALALAKGQTTFIFGSLYLASEVKKIQKRNKNTVF